MNFRQLVALTSVMLVGLFSPIGFAQEKKELPEVIEIVIDNDATAAALEQPVFMEGIDDVVGDNEKTEGKKDENVGVIPKDLKIFVKFETNRGDFIAELDADRAPNTVGNFVEYINNEFYNGLIFHRVIEGFMVQGGGYDEVMEERATRIPVSIESKNGLKNSRGTLAMARAQDPNSATSQFFINTVDNEFLNYPGHDGYGYTVFGKIVDGMDIIDSIEKSKTESIHGYDDVPVDTIIIEKAYLIDKP